RDLQRRPALRLLQIVTERLGNQAADLTDALDHINQSKENQEVRGQVAVGRARLGRARDNLLVHVVCRPRSLTTTAGEPVKTLFAYFTGKRPGCRPWWCGRPARVIAAARTRGRLFLPKSHRGREVCSPPTPPMRQRQAIP